ncbi:Activating signal cointegrator 1 complex subunit 2 [Fusarium oxysporum f. sp. albedinis]|nr:Activating signal cointegrator 1 complex subunit 2 [Fusarium oxysporum f. sp. albedinis]
MTVHNKSTKLISEIISRYLLGYLCTSSRLTSSACSCENPLSDESSGDANAGSSHDIHEGHERQFIRTTHLSLEILTKPKIALNLAHKTRSLPRTQRHTTMVSLPPLAPFPQSSWRQHLSSSEWNTLLQSWTSICRAISSLSEKDIKTALARDDSIATFLVSFAEETAEAGFTILDSHSTTLPKAVFQLVSRVFTVSPPPQLFDYAFLANIARIFPRKATAPLIARLFQRHAAALEAALTALKKQLIPQLEAGIKGDLKSVEARLIRLNYLLHASSDTCTLFLAGSDFLDGLIVCFRVMNPSLRKVILTTTYLCLVGLIDTEPAKWSMLSDQLYALKEAADAHKAGPLNVNDSLVPELITNTPLLKVLLRRAEDTGAATENFKKRITALEGYRKGTMVRPKRLIRRRLDKGKGKITQQEVNADIHVHKMSQITQVQDLFPDLGSGFVSKCLDEYGEDVEQVVANLLSETLPPHLANADRSESLYVIICLFSDRDYLLIHH